MVSYLREGQGDVNPSVIGFYSGYTEGLTFLRKSVR